MAKISIKKSGPFSPKSISNLALWLKADVGVVESGGVVTTWEDQSGNGRNAVSEIGSEPSIVANVLNGKPIIDFNNQKYLTSIFSPINFTSQTVFIVFKYSSNISTYGRVFTQSNDTAGDYELNGNYIPILRDQGNSAMNVYKTYNQWAQGISTSNNTWYISTTKHTGTSISLKLNNTTNTNFPHNLNVSISRFRLGASYFDSSGSPNDYFNSQIAEVIVYDRSLSSEEEQKIENYLDNKYSIMNLSVPEGPKKMQIKKDSIPADPYFNNVSLLLNMNGTNGSTSFVDSSNNNFSATAYGNAQISTAEIKYGNASASFDGDGDYISIPDDSSLDFSSTDDFTIEGWIYFNSLTDGVPLVTKGTSSTSSGWTFYYYSNTLYFGVPYTSNDVNASFTPSLNTWYHLAATRQNNTIRLFIDGQKVAEQSNSVTYSTSENLWIGRSHSSNYLDGYIDDIRITKGIARYTANFSPPNSELPNGSIFVYSSGKIKIRTPLPFVFSPKALSGLELWLDADIGVTLDGNIVTAWADQSDNHNDAIPYSDPLYISSYLNSKPVIDLTSNGGFFQLTNGILNTKSIFAVYKTHNNLAQYKAIVESPLGMYSSIAGGKFGVYLQDEVGFTTLNTETWYILNTTSENGSSSNGYINGTEYSAGGVNFQPRDNTTIGAGDFAIQKSYGYLAEIIIYNRVLTTEERQQIEEFLNNKYAIY